MGMNIYDEYKMLVATDLGIKSKDRISDEDYKMIDFIVNLKRLCI